MDVTDYSAPEILSNTINESYDIFSLGIILFELFFGIKFYEQFSNSKIFTIYNTLEPFEELQEQINNIIQSEVNKKDESHRSLVKEFQERLINEANYLYDHSMKFYRNTSVVQTFTLREIVFIIVSMLQVIYQHYKNFYEILNF